MRINEFNVFQNFLSNVTGAVGKARQPSLAQDKTAQSARDVAAAAKRGEQTGLGTEDQLAMDTFVDRFVSRGSNALDTAIKQNLVDVTSPRLNPPGDAETDKTGTQQPGAGGAAGAQPGAAGADQTGAQAGAQPGAAGADQTDAQAGAQPGDADLDAIKKNAGLQSEPAAGPSGDPGAGQGQAGAQAGDAGAGAQTGQAGAAGAGAAGASQAQAGQAGDAGTGAADAAGASQAQAGQAGAAKVKAPGDAAVATGQKQGAVKPAIDQNVDKIVSAMRKLQPAGTKPLPAQMKKKKDPTTGKMVNVRIPTSNIEKEIVADLDKVSTNKDYLLRVGERILKANNAGYDIKDLHRQFMAQYAKGNKQKSIQESISHERLTEIYRKLSTQEKFRRSLKRAGYDPDEAAKRIRDLLKKQQQEREQYRDVYKDLGVDIDKHKVDIDENDATAPPAGDEDTRPSIGEWLRDNFMKNFLKGINLGTSQKQVDDILKNMPNLYKSGKINQALTDIANIAWAVSDQGRRQDK